MSNFATPASAVDIHWESLNLNLTSSDQGTITVREVLTGEIPGVTTDVIQITGPDKYTEETNNNQEVVWLFLGGSALLSTNGQTFTVKDETIAHAPLGWQSEIEVATGDTLLAVRIRKLLSDEDKADLLTFAHNSNAPYVRRFIECTRYSEVIKSAKTVSRTLLTENVVPRMAAGTVETTGPDQVDRHKHPMLEQLFLALQSNNATFSADDTHIAFPPLSILHVPSGSMHGCQVAAGNKLYYVWLDFFPTKEGQEWLRMHKPIEEKPVQGRPA
jgi:hypothetical protein